MRRLQLAILPLLLTTFSLSCGGNDPEPPTFCESYCAALDECRAKVSRVELASLGSVTCEVDALGPERAGCVVACEGLVTGAACQAPPADPQACFQCYRDDWLSSCDPEEPIWRADCAAVCADAECESEIFNSVSCWVDEASRPAAQCGGRTRSVAIGAELPGASFAGTATVAFVGTSSIGFEDQQGLTIFDTDVEVRALSAGQVVDVDLKYNAWVGRSFVVRDPAGLVLLAAWSGEVTLPGITLDFTPSACRSTFKQCVSRLDLRLVVQDGTSSPIEVAPGAEVEQGGLRVINGGAARLFDHWCTDHPQVATSGFLERTGP